MTASKYLSLSSTLRKIVQHMRRAGHITALDAMVNYGMTSATLARRVCDLEDRAVSIVRERAVHPVSGQRYTRYKLAA